MLRPTYLFSGLTLVLSTLSALAANVSQSGNVTPGHLTAWATTGVVKDAGTATNPFANTFGLIGGPFCINSGPTTGAYNAFCLQVDSTNGGIVSIYNHAGATGGISFSVNGTAQGIPLVPLPTTAGDAACFTNTSGTMADCGGSLTWLSSPPPIGNVAPNIGAFTTLSASSTVSGTGFSTYLASPPAIGGTAPNTGAFTTLTGTSLVLDSAPAGGQLSVKASGSLVGGYFEGVGSAGSLSAVPLYITLRDYSTARSARISIQAVNDAGIVKDGAAYINPGFDAWDAGHEQTDIDWGGYIDGVQSALMGLRSGFSASNAGKSVTPPQLIPASDGLLNLGQTLIGGFEYRWNNAYLKGFSQAGNGLSTYTGSTGANPFAGWNINYVGGNWVYGEGSVIATNYGATNYFNSASEDWGVWLSTTKGDAGSTATMSEALSVTPTKVAALATTAATSATTGSLTAGGGVGIAGALWVGGGLYLNALIASNIAPTIASGFCSTASNTTISASNGTAAFDILIGGATCGSTGTLTLPAATTGWVCNATDVTTPASHNIVQTGTQGSTTAVVLTDYARTTGIAQNFNPADHIHVQCTAF